MITVEFLGPLSKEPMEVDIKNLAELKDILKDDESLSEWLDSVAVALNDEIVSSLDIELKDGDRVSLLPPVCGG
jgi:molybdopterin synthase sulfur carrier subunit